jgi:hypothetical protein
MADKTDLQTYLDAKRAALEAIEQAKKIVANCDRAIAEAYTPAFSAAFARKGIETGEITLGPEALGGLPKATGIISKTVKWDSDALRKVAAKMPQEDAIAFFDVKISMPEKQFAMLEEMEHPLLDEIILARSVKVGVLTVKVAEPKS